MPDFTHRSLQPELIDAEVSPKLFRKNLSELHFLNRYLGGFKTSLSGISQLIQNRNQLYHIVDIGCGGGGFLRHAARWARKNSIRVQLTGVDIHSDAIGVLRQHCRNYPEITGMVSDYVTYLTQCTHPVDIVHASLFCHHLTDAEIIDLFRFCTNHINTGFVCSDLFREKLPYYGSKMLSHMAMGTPLSRHDGPLSVLRSFTIPEMHKLLKAAAVERYVIERRFIFRMLIIGYANHRN